MQISKQLLHISFLKRCNVSAMHDELLSCEEETTHNTHICEHHCNEYMQYRHPTFVQNGIDL